jgi:hypothetical protein
MHDPMTVAFEVRAPWFRCDRHFPSGRYHPALVTVWHVDPETDGSDDSCDWFGRKLTPAGRALAKEMAEWEEKFPYYFTRPSTVQNPEYPTLRSISPGDTLAFVLSVFWTAAWRLERRDLSARDIRRAIGVSVTPDDNFQGSFTRKEQTQDKEVVFAMVIAAYLRGRRPWYRHPRFHLHHWKVQVHAVQRLKRWLFSRCASCGRRFRYGEAPVSGSWHGTGPRWFRGEPNVRHSECAHAAAMNAPAPGTENGR